MNKTHDPDNADRRQPWSAVLDPRSAVGVAAAITILTAMLSPSCGGDDAKLKTAHAEYLNAQQQRFTEALNDR